LLTRASFQLVIPLVALIALTVVFRYTSVDLAITRLAFAGPKAGFVCRDSALCPSANFLYHYGTWPGNLLGIVGLTVGLLGIGWRRLRPWRNPGLFLAALLVLGPGLLINGILKPLAQRPRPLHVQDFGGPMHYVPVWGEGQVGGGRSFPCGHASMGFLLMGPAFWLRRRRPALAWGFLMLGLVGGLTLGFSRVMTGDHFASDVVWAGGAVYFSGVVLAYLFGFDRPPAGRVTTSTARPEARQRQAA
jgi:membrane-associated PAP2 superfamily phosphatase